MLKGHAVTLTFKVAAQILNVTCRLNMVIISVKLFRNMTLNNIMGQDMILLQDHALTLTFKVETQMLRATHRLNMVVISVKLFRNPTSNNKVIGRTRMCRTDGRTD